MIRIMKLRTGMIVMDIGGQWRTEEPNGEKRRNLVGYILF